MSANAACFSPYMLISSTLQTVFGFDRRNEQEKTADLNMQLQLELRTAREEFQDDLEAEKIANMRAKMAIARKYRAEEKFEQTVLQHKTEEMREFFMKYLPIKRKCIPNLLDEALSYKALGYNANCPLNALLLHTYQNELDYNEINDIMDAVAPILGNISYKRWCDKDVAHNAAIFNLHAIMSNIPTVVISPYYYGGAIHFNSSMWEAQSETRPMIRPLFSIECPQEYLGQGKVFSAEGKNAIQKRIALISIIISGCARDSYMLMTQGLSPTLPFYLKNNPDLIKTLLEPEYKDVCTYLLNEYNYAKTVLSETECVSKLLTSEEMHLLASSAANAEQELRKLTGIIN